MLDRLGEIAQVLFGRALVGTEMALVFPGKRSAEVIFQQAGRAHNQGLATDLIQQPSELFQDIGRELRRPEIPSGWWGIRSRICSSSLYFWSAQCIRPFRAMKVYIRSAPMKVGFRDAQACSHFVIAYIRQDARRQQHAG